MSNITFAPFPIPVVTPKGSGYIVYVKCNAMWENDEVCVVMDDGGQWLHFNTGQIKSWKNATYGINAGPSKEEKIEAFLAGRHRAWREAQKPEREPKNEWTDALVVEWSASWASSQKLPGVKVTDVDQYLHTFKTKHNIK